MTDTPQEPTPRTEGPTPRADRARAGMAAELAGITDALENLTAHMDQSLPEERVKALLENASKDDRNSRKRLQVLIIGLLALAVLISGSSLVQTHSNGATLREAKVTSDYVRNCLKPNSLTIAEKTKLCGDTTGALKGLIAYLNCAFLIVPAERTEAKLNGCAAKAFGS
jgi:hypothetical protein